MDIKLNTNLDAGNFVSAPNILAYFLAIIFTTFNEWNIKVKSKY